MSSEASVIEAAGPFRQPIDGFVELGLLECLREANPARRDGAEEGLRICEDLHDGDVEEIESALISMQELTEGVREALGAREATHDDYLRHTAATLMVARCFEMLKVAHRLRHDEFYGEPFITRRGKLQPNPSWGVSEVGQAEYAKVLAAA